MVEWRLRRPLPSAGHGIIMTAANQGTVKLASNNTETPSGDQCYKKIICSLKRAMFKAAKKLKKAVDFVFCCASRKEPKKLLEDLFFSFLFKYTCNKNIYYHNLKKVYI
ncbi:hypothetical protein PYW07_000393 [Mythimna separata]|uniref:Uncharacterized protein n=1 Tax=Mythimna separata TaxID=271217 RepID=A0AAD7Z2U8_MYTSE|nr:hypothetical protein PYW07_000393 [Mythimna separata]